MKKMYILVMDDIPLGFAITAVAHAAVACTLKYEEHDDFQDWLDKSFRKVICKVSRKEFERAREEVPFNVVMTESSLDGKTTAIAFCPREIYPKSFKFFKLFKS